MLRHRISVGCLLDIAQTAGKATDKDDKMRSVQLDAYMVLGVLLSADHQPQLPLTDVLSILATASDITNHRELAKVAKDHLIVQIKTMNLADLLSILPVAEPLECRTLENMLFYHFLRHRLPITSPLLLLERTDRYAKLFLARSNLNRYLREFVLDIPEFQHQCDDEETCRHIWSQSWISIIPFARAAGDPLKAVVSDELTEALHDASLSMERGCFSSAVANSVVHGDRLSHRVSMSLTEVAKRATLIL